MQEQRAIRRLNAETLGDFDARRYLGMISDRVRQDAFDAMRTNDNNPNSTVNRVLQGQTAKLNEILSKVDAIQTDTAYIRKVVKKIEKGEIKLGGDQGSFLGSILGGIGGAAATGMLWKLLGGALRLGVAGGGLLGAAVTIGTIGYLMLRQTKWGRDVIEGYKSFPKNLENAAISGLTHIAIKRVADSVLAQRGLKHAAASVPVHIKDIPNYQAAMQAAMLNDARGAISALGQQASVRIENSPFKYLGTFIITAGFACREVYAHKAVYGITPESDPVKDPSRKTEVVEQVVSILDNVPKREGIKPTSARKAQTAAKEQGRVPAQAEQTTVGGDQQTPAAKTAPSAQASAASGSSSVVAATPTTTPETAPGASAPPSNTQGSVKVAPATPNAESPKIEQPSADISKSTQLAPGSTGNSIPPQDGAARPDLQPGQQPGTPKPEELAPQQEQPQGQQGQYRPAYPLKDVDLSDEVVNTIAGEARNNQASEDAVINTMLNRVGSKGYGPSKNLQEVASAPGQFAAYNRGRPDKERAQRIRDRIKAYASGQLPDPTNGANEFRTTGYSGPWSQHHPEARDIGGNSFAYNPQGIGTYASHEPQTQEGKILEGIQNGEGVLVPDARMPGESIVDMANQKSTRSQEITPELKAMIDESVRRVYGDGYKAQVYSGGQPTSEEGGPRTGTTRHDHGKAADLYVIDPKGNRVRGEDLAKLGQYWLAKGNGGVGMEMHGGGIHLDQHTDRARHWNYDNPKDGGSYSKAQDSRVQAGLNGEYPEGLHELKPATPDPKDLKPQNSLPDGDVLSPHDALNAIQTPNPPKELEPQYKVTPGSMAKGVLKKGMGDPAHGHGLLGLTGDGFKPVDQIPEEQKKKLHYDPKDMSAVVPESDLKAMRKKAGWQFDMGFNVTPMADGGTFTTSGPTLVPSEEGPMLMGERGPEMVTVTPMNKGPNPGELEPQAQQQSPVSQGHEQPPPVHQSKPPVIDPGHPYSSSMPTRSQHPRPPMTYLLANDLRSHRAFVGNVADYGLSGVTNLLPDQR
jgi:hypothetical protein